MMRPQDPKAHEWTMADGTFALSDKPRLVPRGQRRIRLTERVLLSPAELYPPNRALLVPAKLFPSRMSSVLGSRTVSASHGLSTRRTSTLRLARAR